MFEPSDSDPLATPARPPSAAGRLGVYIHFPYCLSKCPYCDFASHASRRQSIDGAAYANAVVGELADRASCVAGRVVQSIFFGGGTPSLWDARELGRVIRCIRSTLPVTPALEVTVECNPSSLDDETALQLADVGVDRLSVGVQSLRADHLRYLGRLHDAEGARRAVRAALSSGASRVSADLIFGIPGQSPEDAAKEVLEVLQLGVTHLSCYQLTIEAGTPFGELARCGRLPLADECVVAEAYIAIDEALAAGGMHHYEISNYARPGDECRHNLGYWSGNEYLGLGCGAVGFIKKIPVQADAAARGARDMGVRWRNTTSPTGYLEQARTGEIVTGAVDREDLDAEALLRERIMLGLRLDSGVDIDEAAAGLGILGWSNARTQAAAGLVQRGRLIRAGGRVRIPKRAWLWTDATAAHLF
jgi:oxygen-independent coproporphyrinogen-3 oxidase